jgi:glutamate/tyrosine decarboxylase-like PLP-dependent enzyme
MRDKRARNFVVCTAPYVFKGGQEEDEDGHVKFIGQFVLEGSKPGAAATACWLAHKCVPLNHEGYGRIIGDTINAIVALKSRLSNNKKIGKYIQFLTEPDLNMLCFRIKFPGKLTLSDMNHINQQIYESFQEGRLLKSHSREHVEIRRFILSETSFAIKDFPFMKEKFYISGSKENDSVTFLRISLMNPYAKFLFEKFEKNLEEKVLMAKEEYKID